MINAGINNKILSLWEKRFGVDWNGIAPIFYDDFKTGGILFIGMNPSFAPQKIRTIVKDTEFENLDPEAFYAWSHIAVDTKNVDTCIEIGRYVHAKYGYFKRMHEIADECRTFYQHIDLFVYRQTKQDEFLPLVRNVKTGTISEFGREQLAIFLEALREIQPVVIVVANASASRIVQEEFREKLSYDEEHGFHLLTLDSEEIPIFFSSMLSGSGALDNGSYERLKWHIRQAFLTTESPR